ncbi:MAG TPA: 50S ribosomal protein L25 [Microthrixaceae bacterium]|nr:50S ribosomal protein L25 [Microthrixaceae bacterium]HMV73568.1 50S ribosomal protein L25 [Microthrixaceae bacterium]HMX08022.1 50S ribosomal protein L25 [Microthrixaceae bacterium]HMY86467.1 50S ribosomal protein L25 [Microthrixaceae bacterium]HNE35229.1 50S ribosomal protein L25 [Microthrixaceae bacterium]
MSEVTLTASTGRETGTRPSRRLRREGLIPGVVYGEGKDATVLSVDRKELRRALSTDAGQNALISLTVDGTTYLTVVKELQRHPVRREVTHVDFLTVDPDAAIEVEVPIHLVGEAKEVSQNGGITEQRLMALKVLVKPGAIPDGIDADITDLTLTTTITAADLVLPAGVELVTDPEQAVVTAELTRAAVTARNEGDDSEGGDGDAEAAGDGDAEG